jgi:hypothetical protein
MKFLFPFSLFMLGLMYSCKVTDRQISTYVVKNHLVKRVAGSIDTCFITQTYYGKDRRNRSYLEIAKYRDQTIISTDLFNDPVRLNLFAGFTRGFSFYDKYEKVTFIALNQKQITDFTDFYKRSVILSQDKRSVILLQTKLQSAKLDYALSDNVFISIDIWYMMRDNTNKRPLVKGINIWMNGRRFDIDPIKFSEAMGVKIDLIPAPVRPGIPQKK